MYNLLCLLVIYKAFSYVKAISIDFSRNIRRFSGSFFSYIILIFESLTCQDIFRVSKISKSLKQSQEKRQIIRTSYVLQLFSNMLNVNRIRYCKHGTCNINLNLIFHLNYKCTCKYFIAITRFRELEIFFFKYVISYVEFQRCRRIKPMDYQER